MKIIEILRHKQQKCYEYAEQHREEQHYWEMKYAQGQAKAYDDAINLVQQAADAISEANLRRLLKRFVPEQHIGVIIVNIRANIMRGFEIPSEKEPGGAHE